MTARPGAYGWDPDAHQFLDASGRLVPRTAIRGALDLALQSAARRMTTLGDELRIGELAGNEWVAEMAALVKDVHLYSAAAARGGWANMTSADFGRVGALVKVQYRYLNRFAGEIADGLVLDGSFRARSELYAEAGRGTYYVFQTLEMTAAGKQEERNVLHPAEHCQACIDQTERGWVPIGELVPIGARDCLGRCHCTLEYR